MITKIIRNSINGAMFVTHVPWINCALQGFWSEHLRKSAENVAWTSLVNPGCRRFTWTLATKSKCCGKPNSDCHVGLGNFHLMIPGQAKSGQHAGQSTRINEWSIVTTEEYPMPANLSGLLQFLQHKHLHQRVVSFFARTHVIQRFTRYLSVQTSCQKILEGIEVHEQNQVAHKLIQQ